MTSRNQRRRDSAIAATIVLAIAAAITVFVLIGDHTSRPEVTFCGDCGHVTCAADLDICDSGLRGPGGTIVVAVGRSPKGWNPGSIRGSAGDTAEEVTPLLPSAYVFMPSGKIRYNRDLLAGEPRVITAGPVQVVYRISPHAVWNDGSGAAHPVTAQDFVFAWRTHDGHDKRLPVATMGGYELISNVEGSDDGRTVTVTLTQPYAGWQGLFTLLEPYWFAAAATGADPTDAASMTDTQLEKAFAGLDEVPKFSAGPYMISRAAPGGDTAEVPNPRWYGAIKPTLTTITFRPTDSRNNLTLLQNQDIDVFTTATPDIDTVQQLSNIAGVTYYVTPGYTWEQLAFNTTDPFLRDAKLREAIMDVIGVQPLIEQYVRPYFPGAERLYSHNLLPGQAGYQEIIKDFDPVVGTGNLGAAAKLLTDAGYTGAGVAGATGSLRTPDGRPVTITLVHTDTVVRDRSAQLIRASIASLGATVIDRPTADMSGTLAAHRFGIAEFSLAGSPLGAANLDRWGTGGVGNFTSWGDAGSDGLLAATAATMDPARQAQLLNQQDKILTAAHVDLPLYQLPQLIVVDSQYVNIRPDVGGYITYNTQEWGLYKSA